ncbi:MAG: ABC transporter permease subunit, partial [Rubrobacteridae bacterium]|nr:ABC transporter permease subunit [Rubrobacteridae bacterium]
MFALVGSGMLKYDAYQGSGQSMTDLLAQFPKTVRVVLGFSDLDLSTAIGFYGVLFFYIALMVAIHAVLLGAGIIAKEERDRTSEFLFVKPISRPKVITQKLLAVLTVIVIINVVTALSSLAMVGYYEKGQGSDHTILLLMAGAFFIQVIFASIGMAVAAVFKKPKSSSSFAAAIMMLTFVFSIAVDLNENLGFLKYLSPFKYFDAKSIIGDNSISALFTAISILISISAVAITYYGYTGRDLRV